MSYTKEEVISKIKESYLSCKEKNGNDEVLINQVIQKARFKSEDKNKIFKLFNVSKYEEIIKTIPHAEILDGDGKNKTMKIVNNSDKKDKQNEETQIAIHDRIEKLLAILRQGLYEKDEAIRLALLTAISGESIFFLGAPGCAKSMIARRIVQAFKSDEKDSLKYFEYLMNQFSTPEDIFGNISLKALNGEGENGKEEYKRLTEGFLPQADIAFLDEIWKASPAIQNTLLTIINERKFHNGSKVEDVPLKALFAASNELPAKNEGLEALYDRFILRLVVDFIQNEESFFEMIQDSSTNKFEIQEVDKNLLISNEELKEWKSQIDKVTLSEESKSVISAIRKEMTLQNEKLSKEEKDDGELFEVGDRRWKKITHILKTSAFLNDRTEVDLMDCSLIENCIWGTEKQHKKAREIVEKCIRQNGLDCDTAIEDIQEQIEEYDKYINANFYVYHKKEPKKYKMNDGKMAYKIIDPTEINSYGWCTPYYICQDYRHSDHDRTGAYYDDNKDIIGDYDYYFKDNSFQINNNKVTWIDGYRQNSCDASIEMTGNDGLVKDSKVFDTPDFLELRKNKANSEKYTPIKSFIDSEIKKLDDFANEKTAPYKANLFANQEYCNVIMDTVTKAKKALQDTQVELDKKRSRYQ